ncbi:hypothetical protein BDV28DRAFT_126709 [Aspergillus coremiiformis]|uniref:DUF6314 domain-containing protein n=1 Tax=Aspergillus coremiiformis TaxID=138285 RepID=A0A5N6ZH34_9EURO|nr:hypothetical protein BDV28DRAFT_126709 [Aspergillus coremiiformis]
MTQPTPPTPKMRPQLTPHQLTTLFTSLTRPTTPWTLHRTLKSDNPLDINGDLHGTATFTPLSPSTPNQPRDILYHEEGEMPPPPNPHTHTVGIGLRFTKKYIWRLHDGQISVWFAKVGTDSEPDYLFHEFEFREREQTPEAGFVEAPDPPSVRSGADTVVYRARGNHLCINDMYRTAYAFRVADCGEVVSWASRHVVRGPRKGQDIVNFYV